MLNSETEYEFFERVSGSVYNRKCIDGKITGCGNCVGYCKYCEHPGFLTKKQRERHDCLEKKCRHYLSKERTESKKNTPPKTAKELLSLAQKCAEKTDDIRILRSRFDGDKWAIDYVSVFGNLELSKIEKTVSDLSGLSVRFQRLD